MKTIAKLNNLRISPRKVRLVADLIRGMDVSEAKSQLSFLLKRSSLPMLKLLNSAIANAKHNHNLDDSSLYISEIFVTEGPTLKRIMPRAMGRAFHIRKRMSHITLVLDERESRNNKELELKKDNKEDKKESSEKSSEKVVVKKAVKKAVVAKKSKTESKKISKKDKK